MRAWRRMWAWGGLIPPTLVGGLAGVGGKGGVGSRRVEGRGGTGTGDGEASSRRVERGR